MKQRDESKKNKTTVEPDLQKLSSIMPSQMLRTKAVNGWAWIALATRLAAVQSKTGDVGSSARTQLVFIAVCRLVLLIGGPNLFVHATPGEVLKTLVLQMATSIEMQELVRRCQNEKM
eukprot:2261989-Amphidinium_carterae.2